jgi:hypothetical protein
MPLPLAHVRSSYNVVFQAYPRFVYVPGSSGLRSGYTDLVFS